ncbi:transmembrane protein, putative [Medicago truncatula]|uniref:Transmembrane protein, putative n=1 Tax=Medicago truncatula TaxID=3880 RepID=A0A072VP12_MEDTR|nr:transmembrane protein, putative [Medicago truncatula]
MMAGVWVVVFANGLPQPVWLCWWLLFQKVVVYYAVDVAKIPNLSFNYHAWWLSPFNMLGIG